MPIFLNKVCLFFILFACTFSSIAQENTWKFKREVDGIKVFVREQQNSSFKELMAKSIYESNLSSLIAVSMDINSYNDWVYSSKEAKVLDIPAPNEIIYYTVSEVPWPFQDRDVIVHSIVTQDPATKEVTIVSKAVEDYYPVQKDIVRVKQFEAIWKLVPKTNGEVETIYNIKTDPGGYVPAWLVNMFIDKGPINSFTGLRNLAQEEPYKSAEIDYIVNQKWISKKHYWKSVLKNRSTKL